MCDIGASVNVIPITFARKLGFANIMKSSICMIQLVDQSSINPLGELHNVFVKIGRLTFAADFIVIGTHEIPRMEVIFGRLFDACFKGRFNCTLGFFIYVKKGI